MTRFLLVACVALAVGCAPVRPWQRELLTLPAMQLDRPEDQHVLESREGSAGASGSIGSGCGCN